MNCVASLGRSCSNNLNCPLFWNAVNQFIYLTLSRCDLCIYINFSRVIPFFYTFYFLFCFICVGGNFYGFRYSVGFAESFYLSCGLFCIRVNICGDCRSFFFGVFVNSFFRRLCIRFKLNGNSLSVNVLYFLVNFFKSSQILIRFFLRLVEIKDAASIPAFASFCLPICLLIDFVLFFLLLRSGFHSIR